MRRPRHNTTSLPRDLRAELGIRDTYGEKKNKRNGPALRKERRREERSGKKQPQQQQRQQYHQRGPPPKKRGRYDDDEDEDEDMGDFDEFDLDEGDDDEDAGDVMAKLAKAKAAKGKAAAPASAKEEKKPKSILKKAKVEESSEEEDIDLDEDEDEDEVTMRRPVSKTVQSKLEEDDAEIAALEKKLGLKKGKKLPKSFEEDGLGDLLGDLDEDSADEGRKRKREADEWLRSKRRKAQGLEEPEEEDSEEEDDSDMGDGLEGFDDDDSMGDFDEDEEEGEEEKPAPKKKKENPYVAPVKEAESRPQKYIPPSLRAASNSEDESLVRLRRQAQGHLNKLSEANMVSILAEFEKLYRDHPRQNVTSTLISLLFGLICERSALSDTFIILHAGFIAAVYKIVGTDFGAEIVQKIVETFDARGDERGKFEGKETINLISLLSQLYNFHVIGSPLVFDYIRLFLEEINEENTELLLKIIRNSGPQLRQDDPSSLKDIVLLIQPAVAKAGEAALSVRTKFMIDTITDLKNNKLKSNVNASISTEHITKMRKILGSLNNTRVIRASEPISISRADIHNSEKKGKWWLVGASWREDPLESARKELNGLPTNNTHADVSDSDSEPDLVNIAKAHRMNTDVRRSIFVAIMSATDYQDAHVRLLKLRLKRAQEFEIPRVLTHCAMEEEAHNPYYTLIAKRLCGEMGRRIKVSFMYTLWNIFKRMGESGDMDDSDDDDAFDDEDDQNKLEMKSIVNLAKMYGSLIADGTLNLGVLKILNFAYLQPKSKAFVELLLISVIQQSQKQKKKKSKSKSKDEDEQDEKALLEIFLRARETPQIVKGLIFFLRKVVAKTDIVPSGKELKVVKWGCKVAVDALKVVVKEGDAE
ncbi:suppressor of glycerol defect [Aspergillus tubingensis]|uniref:Nuclear protein n=2 Tax=Aspergillus subgen. Circumdati TaxID=2720871 RepID=A0A124BWH9_ASPNG|nr:nuclear protein [Aspergillus tubingensis]GAQ39307.1 nuclear protein [Aspergillus niger]GFN17858.1 nuclear protein [Aspergillus tubingensis]GLA64795.1 suppressor of glycerol defect [Aspergillus tubingensis]GLA83522.1 suppressor of glycerol defect [Aspergillus tubingensis]GLA90915.1 suppressor of glycerol defect [Aspergillus tubingensis]